MTSDLAAKAEAFLFSEGGELPLRKLESFLGTGTAELGEALDALASRLEGSGLALVRTDTSAALAIAPGASQAVQAAYQDELASGIGEAGLEVLAIALYRGPSTRARIEYLRGVNTGSTIRSLLSRGLLERAGNPGDGREYLYRPTAELLAHLGVRAAGELPDFDAVRAELAAFEANSRPQENEHGSV